MQTVLVLESGSGRSAPCLNIPQSTPTGKHTHSHHDENQPAPQSIKTHKNTNVLFAVRSLIHPISHHRLNVIHSNHPSRRPICYDNHEAEQSFLLRPGSVDAEHGPNRLQQPNKAPRPQHLDEIPKTGTWGLSSPGPPRSTEATSTGQKTRQQYRIHSPKSSTRCDAEEKTSAAPCPSIERSQ